MRSLNSAAIPLPAPFLACKFRCRPALEISGKPLIHRRFLAFVASFPLAESKFFPAVREIGDGSLLPSRDLRQALPSASSTLAAVRICGRMTGSPLPS